MQIVTAIDLGRRLQEKRQASGRNQAELAATVGVSRYWLSQIEKGRANASIDLILRILTELGCAIDIVETDGDPFDDLLGTGQ